MKFLNPDSWSGWHLWGSFFLVKWAIHYDPVVWQSALIVFALGIAYELVFDEWLGKKVGIGLFDARGFDGQDVLCCAIGCSLAFIV